ncbi:MAG: tetratricopeptide repeat protein [Candidatus Portnoybacteria bacterium]|nr:tetratricopeptide repeat protein [Candidatus Portnoybacteria bacterium]
MNDQSLQNSRRLEGIKPLVWIVVIGFLLYLPTLFFGFTYLDDNVLILDNYHFLHNISNIFEAFKQQVFHIQSSPAFYYRPMLTISYMLDAQFGDVSSFRYHFTGLIIHLINACLVFCLFKKLNFKKNLSFFFSIIFVVHPVLTQAVAWIPGRNDSLMTLFVLISFIFFIKFLESKTWKNYFFHVLFFVLALFTKESAVFFPILIIFYFYFIRKERLSWNHKWKYVIGWTSALIIWFILRQGALKVNILNQTSIFEMIRSIFVNILGIIPYIGKIIFPFNLSVLPIMKDTTFFYGIIAIILLSLGLIFSKNKKYNLIIFGLIWFLVFLLPSFIRPDDSAFSDFIEHRLYLPMIGFFIILSETWFVKKIVDNSKKLLIVGCIIVVAFSVITLIHSQNLKDRISFWQNAVKNSPHSPLAHRNMGAMYYLDKNFDKAEQEYLKTIEINPNETMVHNNLGLIYMNNEDFDRAEQEYLKEIEINPLYENVYYNFGILRYNEKKFDLAEELWLKTININPEYIDAYYALTVLYQEQKKYDQVNYYIKELEKRGVKVQ